MNKELLNQIEKTLKQSIEQVEEVRKDIDTDTATEILERIKAATDEAEIKALTEELTEYYGSIPEPNRNDCEDVWPIEAFNYALHGLIWALSGEEKEAENDIKYSSELITKNQFKQLKKWLEKIYGEGSETTITYEGKIYTGLMYGNDECFSGDDFYQYFLTDDTLYRAFYEIPDGETDLGNLDYNNPVDLGDADAQYFIDYVI